MPIFIASEPSWAPKAWSEAWRHTPKFSVGRPGPSFNDVDNVDNFDDFDLGDDEDPIIKFRFIQRQTTADDDGD